MKTRKILPMPVDDVEGSINSVIDYLNTFETRHPFLHKIDLLFKNESIADYRASYTIMHPWVVIPYCLRHIRWAWQRVFRGWDERVTWSIDYYLAVHIPEWLKELDKHKFIPSILMKEEDFYTCDNGIQDLTPEAEDRLRKEYDGIVAKIINGFNAYAEDGGDFYLPEAKANEAKFNEGFELFRKYFGTLWW